MTGKIGPLLLNAIAVFEDTANGADDNRRLALETFAGADWETGRLPIVAKFKSPKPRSGETWNEFKARIGAAIDNQVEGINSIMTGDATPIYSAGAVSSMLRPEQIASLAEIKNALSIELDPRIDATLMDDAVLDVGLLDFRADHGDLRGDGVKVAVLDSGIDKKHPFLKIADSLSTCAESDEIPGAHGTHCAGSIASRDLVFPGIAPDVDLINIKVLSANGSGTHTDIARGVDAALDFEADIFSMSLGFNHLPTWSQGGHGWHCPDGRCVLCTSVDNAVALGAVVIVAAGNEHNRANALTAFGHGNRFDTELGCPGQSRRAITVAALTKRNFLPATFSSRGPSAYDGTKPEISAPGVNITSTIPVPRKPTGGLVSNPHRTDLFGRKSGTSMATPIVAGAAALILQYRRANNLSTNPNAVRKDLLKRWISGMMEAENTVGRGRLDLRNNK